MKIFIAATVTLAVTACASGPADSPFEMDADGYYRLSVSSGPDGALDTTKIGESMANGEMFCRERGQTAETGFVTGPDGASIRFRCVDEAAAQK